MKAQSQGEENNEFVVDHMDPELKEITSRKA